MLITGTLQAGAQSQTLQNRPYTDLRTFHFGVVLGAHLQDLELNNVGPITVTDANGETVESVVTVDQDRWDPGFQVGVLGELRLNTHMAFRIAPTMYFGSRHLTFRNYTKLTEQGEYTEERQNLKSVYIAGVCDLIFAAKRHGNHRPYFVAASRRC